MTHRTLALGAAVALAATLALAPRPGEASAPFTLNIGSLAPDPSPWFELLKEVEQHVETKSNGQMNVIIRPPGVMGEVEMVREARKGERLQSAAVTTAALAEGGNVPVLQIVELPYLFDSYAEADHVLDNVIWDDVASVLRRRGFVLGIWSENGWRSFGTKAKPIRSPDDLSGLKMRAQESDVHMAMYRWYGANAVQKPMTEVLTSLNSNVIDGIDTTPLYTLAGGLAEPLDYFSLSQHIYQPAAIVYSRRWFDELPQNLQDLLMEPKEMVTKRGRVAVRQEQDDSQATLAESGVEIVSLSADERGVFRDKARANHAAFASTLEGGPEMLKKIQSALDAMR